MGNRSNFYVDNMKVINILISKIIEYVSNYSTSIAKSIRLAWDNYLDKESCLSKKERSLRKLYNKFEQLIIIENKKNIFDVRIKKSLESFVLEMIDISSKSRNCLIDIINKSNSCGVLFRELVNYYLLLEKEQSKIETRKIVGVELPKRKKDYFISKYVDSNNFVYFNIMKENGLMIIDQKSFKNENKMYFDCLNKRVDFDIWKTAKGKLSPFEKRRKLYIQSSFKLESELLNLKDKKVDITYPIEKYYIYANDIINNLYYELIFFNNNSIYDNLFEMTINSYGCYRLLNLYQDLVTKVDVRKLNEVEVNEFRRVADIYKKKNNYIHFVNVNNMVPTNKDILSSLNFLIINNVKRNIKEYFLNMDVKLQRITKYMSIDEIILLYKEIKNILFRSNYDVKNRINKYKILKKYIISIISTRFNLDEDVIINKYFFDD